MQIVVENTAYLSNPVPPVRKCGLPACPSTTDLQRCSRCKSIWYCGRDHQLQDWAVHRQVCKDQPVSPIQHSLHHTYPIVNSNNGSQSNSNVKVNHDDDVLEVETLVSLTCPLSVERIVTPAKGKKCSHPTCFDLKVRIYKEFNCIRL